MAAVFDVKKEIPVNGFSLMSRESEIGYCSWGAETPKQRSWLVLEVAPGSEHDSH